MYRRQQEERPNKEVVAFYNKLLPIITQDVFKKGEWVYLNVFDSGALARSPPSPFRPELS